MKFYHRAISFLSVLTFLWIASLPIFAQDGSAEHIKGMLGNAYVLYGLMLAGSVVSMVKQWSQNRMDGGEMSFGDYAKHLPELLTTLFGNTVAFLLLIDGGNLNFISALSIGYVINSAADLNPMGGRSTALVESKKE